MCGGEGRRGEQAAHAGKQQGGKRRTNRQQTHNTNKPQRCEGRPVNQQTCMLVYTCAGVMYRDGGYATMHGTPHARIKVQKYTVKIHSNIHSKIHSKIQGKNTQ